MRYYQCETALMRVQTMMIGLWSICPHLDTADKCRRCCFWRWKLPLTGGQRTQPLLRKVHYILPLQNLPHCQIKTQSPRNSPSPPFHFRQYYPVSLLGWHQWTGWAIRAVSPTVGQVAEWQQLYLILMEGLMDDGTHLADHAFELADLPFQLWDAFLQQLVEEVIGSVRLQLIFELALLEQLEGEEGGDEQEEEEGVQMSQFAQTGLRGLL